jgi:hypothetical protein
LLALCRPPWLHGHCNVDEQSYDSIEQITIISFLLAADVMADFG